MESWRKIIWRVGGLSPVLGRVVYRLKKVDTEKIFQLNKFSKVDNIEST